MSLNKEDVFKAQSDLITLASNILRCKEQIPTDPDDWNFPKSVPQYMQREIVKSAEALDEKHKEWAVEIRRIYDSLKIKD